MRLSAVRVDLVVQGFNNTRRLVVRGKKVTTAKRKVAGSIPACENSSSVVDAPHPPRLLVQIQPAQGSSSMVEHGAFMGN